MRVLLSIDLLPVDDVAAFMVTGHPRLAADPGSSYQEALEPTVSFRTELTA